MNNNLSNPKTNVEIIDQLWRIVDWRIRKQNHQDTTSNTQEKVIKILNWFLETQPNFLEDIEIALVEEIPESSLSRILHSINLPRSKVSTNSNHSNFYDGKYQIGYIRWWDKKLRDTIIRVLKWISLLSTQDSKEKYEHLSKYDSLTGLPNRFGFINIINKTLDENIQSVAMCFDFNKFKAINDTYWHAIGDAALRLFADVCRDICSDYAGTIARTGGDEFMGIFPWKTSIEGQEIAQEIQDRLKNKFNFSEDPIGSPNSEKTIENIPFTVSIGLTDTTQHSIPTTPKEGTTPLQEHISKLLHRADKAATAAKKMKNNNHIAVWEESFDADNDMSESKKQFFEVLGLLIREWQNETKSLPEISRGIIEAALLNLEPGDIQLLQEILREMRGSAQSNN